MKYIQLCFLVIIISTVSDGAQRAKKSISAYPVFPAEIQQNIIEQAAQTGTTIVQTVAEIKKMREISTTQKALIDDPAFFNTLIQRISHRYKQDPIVTALYFSNAQAKQWLQNYIQNVAETKRMELTQKLKIISQLILAGSIPELPVQRSLEFLQSVTANILKNALFEAVQSKRIPDIQTLLKTLKVNPNDSKKGNFSQSLEFAAEEFANVMFRRSIIEDRNYRHPYDRRMMAKFKAETVEWAHIIFLLIESGAKEDVQTGQTLTQYRIQLDELRKLLTQQGKL